MEKAKETILSFVDSKAREQVQFVIDLCNQNSYTFNKRGVDRIAEMIAERLRSIFPFHHVVEQSETGNVHLFKSTSSAKSVYLLGHMDTVFPPDHPFQECRLEGDMLNGPGAGDMKGGLAIFVFVLRALKEAGILPRFSLALVLTGDEEIGSPHSRSLFLKERENAAACLAGECAGLEGEIVVSRNGKMGVQVDCFGQDRHVGFGTHEKASAVLELAHKVINFESLNACLPGVSLNAGKIEGGLGPCTIPGHARCLLDIRWSEEEHKQALLEKIREEIDRTAQPGCRSEWRILNWRPAMPLQKGSEELFRMVRQVGEGIGLRIAPEHRRGTSDANFFGASGIPTLDGFGPVCDKDHTPEEIIKISSLKERTALLALSLVEIGSKMGLLS